MAYDAERRVAEAAVIEACKASLYGLDPADPDNPEPLTSRATTWRPPFGVVLPLRPFGQLYEQAFAASRAS